MLTLLFGPIVLGLSVLVVIASVSLFQTRNWREIGDKLDE